jgi:N-dimethylarginine dimethylaminohydrolase
MLYASVSEIDFEFSEIDDQPLPGHVLMVRPDHYQVEYVINPHMEDSVGTVDAQSARSQWEDLAQTYTTLGFRLHEIDGDRECPDMVFCANQTLPGLDVRRRRRLMPSNMASEQREPEVKHFETFFSGVGYQVSELAGGHLLEGCGDAIWHHDLRLLWCGHGFRSGAPAYAQVCDLFGVRGVLLELVDPALYHLDTCLSIINRETALWVPSAFSSESAELIHELVPRLIEVPREEAIGLLACNAHSPDGKHVIIQSGCLQTASLLHHNGCTMI